MNTPNTLYSIGHSSHTIENFIHLLQLHKIKAIADVRSTPYSRHHPQFNRESFEKSLKKKDISYVFLGTELGARRDEPECYEHFKVNYSLVAQTPTFLKGVKRLINGASKMKVAMLCAEKDPITCHRTILIAQYAKESIKNLHHILRDGTIETQEQAEERLLSEYGLDENDFFISREERLKSAYGQRAERIGHQKEDSSASLLSITLKQ